MLKHPSERRPMRVLGATGVGHVVQAAMISSLLHGESTVVRRSNGSVEDVGETLIVEADNKPPVEFTCDGNHWKPGGKNTRRPGENRKQHRERLRQQAKEKRRANDV